MSTPRIITVGCSAMLLSSSTVSYAIPVPSGTEPGANDTTFDAVCAVGKRDRMTGVDALDWMTSGGVFDPLRSGGNTGTGALIAPNLVLTARHLWSFGDNCPEDSIDDYLCAPWESCNTNKHWVVRFRRNPDGTVGTMNEFPVPPSTVRGPESFHHVHVIGAIELGNCTDSVILVLDENVDHIEPLPLVAVDPRRFPTIGLNNPHPIEPFPNTHVSDVIHDVIFAGWGSSTAPSNAQGSGQLRIRTGGEGTFNDSGTLVAVAHGDQPVSLHDSGGPILIVNDDGSVAAIKTVRGYSSGGSPIFYSVGGAETGVWFGEPQVDGLIEPPVWFDLTGSADPLDPAYGAWDGRVDLLDVLYVAAETTLGNTAVDFTTTSDPNGAGYGTPDGVADAEDYAYYADLLETRAASNVGPWPPLPLSARGTDNTGDGRFTPRDYSDPGLTPGQLAKFDFDRDGSFGAADAALAADIESRFGHGELADLDGDGNGDIDDLETIIDVLETKNPWDGYTFGDSEYRSVLDANLDGHTTVFDRRAIAAYFLPGEVADAQHIDDLEDSPLGAAPDFTVTRWDRFAAFWEFLSGTGSNEMLDTSSSGDPASPLWGIPDQATDGADFRHFLSRQFDLFGPDGDLPDPEVTARMWPGFDADGDGRLTYGDYEYLQALSPASAEALLWDLDGDGVFTPYDGTGAADTLLVFNAIFTHEWNQGQLGDFDGDTDPTDCCIEVGSFLFCIPDVCVPATDSAPDCDDFWAIYEEIQCRNNNLFDGRSFFSDTDEQYLAVLDADLDGDNDLTDQYRVVMVGIGVADLNIDSLLDVDDVNLYLDLYSAGDLAADLAAPFGSLDFNDVSAFMTLFSNDICNAPSPYPRPCTISWP